MSLIEKLSRLSNPQPVFIDPEDNTEETTAKLTEKGDNDENIVVSQTQLQRRSAQLVVDDDDKRYKGKPVSRKSALDEEDEDNEGSLSEDMNEDNMDDSEIDASSSDKVDADVMDDSEVDAFDVEQDDSGSDISDQDMDSFKQKLRTVPKVEDKFVFQDDGDYGKYADDSDASEMSDSEEGDSVDSEGSEIEAGDEKQNTGQRQEETEEGGVQSFSTTDIKEEIQKGQAAKAQIGLWDNLLEYRIRLQKLLVVVNQLPQPGVWETFTQQGGEEYQGALRQSEEALKQLLDQLTHLQSLLLLQYPGTKAVAKVLLTGTKSDKEPAENAQSSSVKDQILSQDSDEEILSDEDDSAETQEVEEDDELRMRLKRKIKMADYPGFLSKRHQLFQPFRDETIQKWYDKTRVSSGKLGKGFSAFESSALKQIQQILSDKDRLIKRTQLKRSTYRVLGGNLEPAANGVNADSSEEEQEDEDTPTVKKDNLKDFDEEIFDDDDFYHQLLRQLIERKTVDMNDPIALSRQWLEIQKLRSKVKKNVDTKASKGRKLRFDVHTKLVNFMAPFETCKWTDQARNDLFKSVFGGTSSNS